MPARSWRMAPSLRLPGPGAVAAALVLLAPACGEQAPAAPPGPPPLRLPGRLEAPDGSRVDVSADSAVILYYWMPLEGYDPSEADLAGICDARRRGLEIFPVQFDIESRNAAQVQVNDQGISLPVFLADSSLARAIPCGALPVAVIYARGAPPRTETGEGCVARLSSQ